MNCADRYSYRRVIYLQGTRTVLYKVVLSATSFDLARERVLNSPATTDLYSDSSVVNSLESHPCAFLQCKWPGITSLRKNGEGVGRLFPIWNSMARGERFHIVRCGRAARWAKIGPAA